MLTPHLIPSIYFSAALVTDLRNRKIPNQLVLASFFASLVNSYYFWGIAGLHQGLLAAIVALAITLPLVLIGVLGAGDMKLLVAFGFTSTSTQVFTLIVISFFWAALVGIVFSVAKGRFKRLLNNMLKIISLQPKKELQTEAIPYMIPIFLSWLTLLYFEFKQGSLW